MSRLLLVDKPIGPTSHDVVEQVRRTLPVKKAGHCGTLDPMASGLLLILTGKATRLAEVFGLHDKLYRATVRFGSATDSDDSQGAVIARAENFHLDSEKLQDALRELGDRQSQRPPLYSAIKVKGVPLYKLARQGRPMPADLPERPVRIQRLELIEQRETELDLEVHCSAGTYVRAIARDLGELLSIPAHLSALRRLRSGPFGVEDAVSPESLAPGVSAGLGLDEALAGLPAVAATAAYCERLKHGAQPSPEDLALDGPLPEPGSWVRLVAPDGELLALARVETDPEPVLRLRRRLGDGA